MTGQLERVNSIAGIIRERAADQLQKLLPKGMDANRVGMRAALYFSRNRDLEKCGRESLIDCVLSAAELGLTLDGRLCYAIPYGTEAQLQVDYKGYVEIARNAGLIRSAQAEVVHRGDIFDWCHEDGKTTVKHKPNIEAEASPENVIGAYACITLAKGGVHYEVMRRADLDRCQRQAKAKNVWQKWYGEMCKKSVLKRALKLFLAEPTIGRLFDADQDMDFDEEPASREISLGTIDARPLAGKNSVFAPRQESQPAAMTAETLLGGTTEDEAPVEPIAALRKRVEQSAVAAVSAGHDIVKCLPDTKTTDELSREECLHALSLLAKLNETQSAK